MLAYRRAMNRRTVLILAAVVAFLLVSASVYLITPG
jgi:hypothetical protein